MSAGWDMPEFDNMRVHHQLVREAERKEYERWLATELPSKRAPAPPPETQGATMTTNYSTAIFLVNDDVRAVSISYEVDKEGKGVRPFVTFKTMDGALEVGDFVVIPTDTRHKRTVVRIEEVDLEVDPASQTQMDWIVGPFNEGPYKQIVAAEQAAIVKIKSAERRRAQDELRAKLLADNPDIQALGELNKPAALAAPPTPEPPAPAPEPGPPSGPEPFEF